MRRYIPFMLLGLLTIAAAFGLGLGIGTANTVTGVGAPAAGASTQPTISMAGVPPGLVPLVQSSPLSGLAVLGSLRVAVSGLDPAIVPALDKSTPAVSRFVVFRSTTLPPRTLTIIVVGADSLPAPLNAGRLPGSAHQITVDGRTVSLAVTPTGVTVAAWKDGSNVDFVLAEGLTVPQISTYISKQS